MSKAHPAHPPEGTDPLGIGVVDAWVNLTEPARSEFGAELDSVRTMFHRSLDEMSQGVDVPSMVARMDATGVALGLLAASTHPFGTMVVFESLEAQAEHLANVVAEHPGRFASTPLLDPKGGLRTLRGMEVAVRDYGAVGFHVFPSGFDIPANDARVYPIYAKAAELGVPVCVNVGIPGPLYYADHQHPSLIDRICIDLPELVLVASHTGLPWAAELVALMAKHANLYLMTSAVAPRYYPEEYLAYLSSSRGRHKLMFASDFPLLGFERCVAELSQLPLSAEVLRGFVKDNALAVFGIKAS